MSVAEHKEGSVHLFPMLLLFSTLSLTIWEEIHHYAVSSTTYVNKDHLSFRVRPCAGAVERDKLVQNFVSCFTKDK